MIQPFSKELAAQIFAEIQKAQSILLHCHRNADADSLGSSLAMKHALESIGKKVTLIQGDTPIPTYISHLPGADSVVKKNYFELDLTEFDLFLILDTGALDRVSALEPMVFPEHLKTINIDHHKSNNGYGQINLVDTSYPATAQIVFDLLKEWGIAITHDAALCMYAGIWTDTGGFVYRSTTPKTMRIVAELAEIAPDFTEMMFTLTNQSTAGYLKAQGILLNSIETWFSNSVAVASATYQSLIDNGVTQDDIAAINIANSLKAVVGWNIGASIIEKEPGLVGISLRSRDSKQWDVAQILGKIGGGGHAAAAGARIKGTIEEAKQALKGAITQTYPSLS